MSAETATAPVSAVAPSTPASAAASAPQPRAAVPAANVTTKRSWSAVAGNKTSSSSSPSSSATGGKGGKPQANGLAQTQDQENTTPAQQANGANGSVRTHPVQTHDHRSNVYIGNLTADVNESRLTELFSPFGTVVRCKIGKKKVTGQPAGYGFVQFETVENARAAINGLHGTTLNGRSIKVSVANPPGYNSRGGQTNLYICALAPSTTTHQLESLFAPYGAIVGSRLLTKPTGEGRGIGFVRFERHDQALTAIQALNGTVLPGTPGLPTSTGAITVKFAREKSERYNNGYNGRSARGGHQGRGGRHGGHRNSQHHQGGASAAAAGGQYAAAQGYYAPHMSPVGPQGAAAQNGAAPPLANGGLYYGYGMPQYGYDMYGAYSQHPAMYQSVGMGMGAQGVATSQTNLYIASLPFSMTKAQLEELFAEFGQIVDSRILTNPDGDSRGIGFVRFEQNESAVAAIQALNGSLPPGAHQPIIVKFARENNRNKAAVYGDAAAMAAAYQYRYTMPYAPAHVAGADTGADQQDAQHHQLHQQYAQQQPPQQQYQQHQQQQGQPQQQQQQGQQPVEGVSPEMQDAMAAQQMMGYAPMMYGAPAYGAHMGVPAYYGAQAGWVDPNAIAHTAGMNGEAVEGINNPDAAGSDNFPADGADMAASQEVQQADQQ